MREREQRRQEVLVPLAHPPGHAQADFGEALVVIGGVECKAHFFVLDLPHSDGCYVRAYVESFNGRMRDELLNESLLFGLDHVRSAIAEWRKDFNTARPHCSLGYQTPAAFAGVFAATGSSTAPVAQPTPNGVPETVEPLIAAG